MKGILFTPGNIQAIREGRKTVTRRLIKPCSTALINNVGTLNVLEPPDWVFTEAKPHYQVGEIVYVKEGWRPYYSENEVRIQYRLDNVIVDFPSKPRGMYYACGQEWHSPLFLPAWAARTFLEILNARPERLQDITEEDAGREGIPTRGDYAILWNSIGKKPSTRWDDNPFVFRYEFRQIALKILML